MRILIFEWKSYGRDNIVRALEESGHEVDRIDFDYQSDATDKDYEKKAIKLLSYHYYDIVFGMNYFASIANACHENGIIYIAWLYDSPLLQVWDTTAYYPECYIFSFDQKLCDGLKKEGIRNVFYMPLAVEAKWLDELQATEEQIERFQGDVSFVGALYDKKTTTEKHINKNNTEFLRGFSDAVIKAQTYIKGYTLLEEVLEPQYVRDAINNRFKKAPVDMGLIASMDKMYANYFLAPAVTLKERRAMIKRASENFQLNVYTRSNISRYKKAINKGVVDYYREMPLVFRLSKVNLNLTLRSIQTGIPLRCWDIMGAGGFLLTNYQADMLKHFEPGVDFDYFLDEEDLLRKIQYYLEHEEERKQIARNGYEKVKKYHTWGMRLKEIFRIVEEGEKWNEGRFVPNGR